MENTDINISNEGFRVVIVGAGITGLVLANLLKRANIAFTLVEAYDDIERPAGGSYGIWPNAARIFDQLDCWDEIKNVGTIIKVSHMRFPGQIPLVSYDISRSMVDRSVNTVGTYPTRPFWTDMIRP